MKLLEVEDPVRQIGPRAGVYPIHTNEKGQMFVYMMVPSDPMFGGPLPQLGKGGIDDGESAEQAAMREGYEELGLIASNVARMTRLTSVNVRGKQEQYLLTVFAAELKDPDNFDPYGWESKWAGWIELEEAIKTSRKNQRQFLQLLKTKYAGKSLNEDFDINDINDKIDSLVTDLGNAEERTGLWRDIKAKISFLRSQIELSKDHGIDPVSGPRRSYSYPSLKEWTKSISPTIKAIKTHCQPYLKEIDNNIEQHKMYRGMRGTDDVVMTGRVRLDGRDPMSTGRDVHRYINRYFQVRYGEQFRNSMFASGKADFAKDYGDLFLVFPRGEFTFIWSPHVIDMFDIDGDIDDAMYPGGGSMQDDLVVDNKNFFNYMDSLKYQTTDMKAALQSEKEIMVRTQAYYGINLTQFFARDDYDDDSTGDQDKINTAINVIQGLIDEN